MNAEFPLELENAHYLRLELEERLASDPSLFEFLRRGSLDGLWFWDLEQREHEWLSPEFWELFGVDPNTREHRSSEWMSIIHPDDLETAIANLERHLSDPTHPYDQVVRYRHADGSTVWVRCRGIAIRDADGRPTRMLGAHNDITALKQAELRRERFVANVSHELRTPLTGVLGALSLVRGGVAGGVSPAVDEVLALAEKNARRLQGLVEQLLDAKDLQSGTLELTRVRCTVASLLAEALASTASTASHELRLAAGVPDVEVLVDPARFRQVLSHLLSNAVRHSPEGGTVTIGAEIVQARLRFWVRDEGPGIPEAVRPRVFEHFSMGDESSTRPSGGSGLGLAIAREIVERHGGHIWFETSCDGTTFHVEIDVADSTA